MNAVVTDRPQAETEGKASPIASVTLDVGDLRKAVTAVAAALDPRSTIPILAMIAMTVSANGEVVLRATDMDDEISCVVPGEATVPFGTAISGRTLVKLLGTLPPGEITLTPADNWVSFVSGEMSGKLPSLPLDDMPTAGTTFCARSFDMPAGDLLRLLESVSHCICTEETRYYLNGVYLYRRDGKLFAVATNGHTLAQASLATPVDGDFTALDAGVIVSRKRIKVLLRHLSLLPEDLQIVVRILHKKDAAPHCIRFSWCYGMRQVSMTLKLVDGTFPDYRRVLPQTFAGRFVVYRSFLRRAAHTLLSVLGETGTSGKRCLGVKLHLDKTSLQVTGYHPTHGHLSTKVTVISHDVAMLGFQARYIVDCMDAFQCEAVTVGFTDDGGGPVMIEPADSGQLSDKQDRVSLTQCIMQMRV